MRGTGIWSTGRVVRVADGLTDKRSKRAQKVLPAGMVLWAWDADLDFHFGEAADEQWLGLLPKKWNPGRQLLYGWRYDPREFAAAPTARDECFRGAVRAIQTWTRIKQKNIICRMCQSRAECWLTCHVAGRSVRRCC